MRSSRFNLWAKIVKLAKNRREKNRKRLLFRSSLVEQFEKRELMAYSVSSIQLVNDTGISSTDKITYDPTLSGSVSNSTETNLASSTHSTIENALTGFAQDTSADQAQLLEKLTQHANSYASTMTNVQGDWLFTKVDARAEYENVLADAHKLRKETLHQQSPTPLTTLQYSIAQSETESARSWRYS